MSWKTFAPSRTLNESGFSVMGLGTVDIVLLICTLSILQPIFHLLFGLSLMIPMLIVGVMAGVLIRIRRKHRRHFIRDYLQYKFFKHLRRGVRYDTKNS